jgi:hypothetical protein
MSLKEYVDELRKKSCGRAGQYCRNHIRDIIFRVIEADPRVDEIEINYDNIFTWDMHGFVVDYLIGEGFEVKTDWSSVEHRGRYGLGAHSDGIRILLDDLV